MSSLIGNVAAGYRLARTHRRQLLAVLLPVLTAALLGLYLLDLLLGRDQTVIINGAPVVHGSETLALAKIALVAACWLIGLVAAVLVVIGARPRTAILTGLKRLPVFAIALCAVAGGTILLLSMVAGIAGGVFGMIIVLGGLTVAAVLAARLLIHLVAPLSGRPVAATAGAFLLGGVAVPLGVSWLADQLTDVIHPVVIRVIGAALITGVVAAQAGILAHIHLNGREAVVQPVRRLRYAGAAAVVALLAPAAVAVVNPFGAPTVRSHAGAPDGAAAVVWPAGKHPVIATVTGARFCDNDVCDEYVTHNGGPGVWDGWGRAAISADGNAVVKAALTGGEGDGGPFINFAYCTRDGCREAWVPVRASAEEPFGWPELAVAAATDGSIWFGLAMASENEKPGEATFGITFLRCPDATCAKPERHRAGTVERLTGDDFTGRQRTALSIGADGRPALTVRSGWIAGVVTCEPVTCANPRTSSTLAGDQDTAWAVTATGQTVVFEPGLVRIGEQMVPLESNELAPRSGAVTAAGSGVYATAAEATPRPGPHITIGTPPEHWQQVLWRCSQERCSRQILDDMEQTAGREALAVADDGSVLIVREDRILLLRTGER